MHSEKHSAENNHDWCLLCGEHNPWSLHLDFQKKGDSVVGTFRPHAGLQGYRGMLHGGVIAALLDSAMTHALFHRGVRAFTADLQIKFIAPIACDRDLELRAHVVSATPPLYQVCAELSSGGELHARAEAKFMQQTDGLRARRLPRPAQGDGL